MTDNCTHSEAEWDWGDVQPSMEHVMVPGWCPTCETTMRRYYTFEEQIAIEPEALI